ncbi:MAG: hypothetical protein FJ388_09710, partial [Verrucomicrobia bacterium]|nr:hypothetical protein [Verrucomicrobiota bacterium]
MIERAEVQSLINRASSPSEPMLSVYLDVDSARELNRQRGFEAALKNMLRALEKQIGGDRERKQF